MAIAHKVSSSTQNQALNALLFLYRHVLEMELQPRMGGNFQELMGHNDVSTTMIYTHGTASPLDATVAGTPFARGRATPPLGGD